MDINNHLNSLEGEFKHNEEFEAYAKSMENWSREDLLYALFNMHKDMDYQEGEIKKLEFELEVAKNAIPNIITNN